MNISLSLFALLFTLSTTACVPPPARPKSMKEKAGAVGEGNSTVDGGSGVGPGTESGTGGAGMGSGDGGMDTGMGTGTGSTGNGDGGTGTGTDMGMGDGGDKGGGNMGTNEPKGPAYQTSERFDELVWLTAHNAFVNDDDGTPWKVLNQSRSLQYQMENGVDAFMIDIHQIVDDKGTSTQDDDNVQVLMCHESCDGIEDPIFHKKIRIPGVHEQMPLLPYFQKFNAYLDKNKDSFITIIIEDYIDHPKGKTLLKSMLDSSGLSGKIFDPYKWDVKGKGWPRVDALRKDNKRLFIISDKSNKKDFGIAYAQDFTSENYWSLGKSETVGLDYSCKPRWSSKLNRVGDNFQYLTVMNHFRDIPSFEFSSKDNLLDRLWKRLNENCLQEYQRKPNFFAVDHFDEADWGARKFVQDLRNYGVSLYKDKNLTGEVRIFKAGKYLAKDLGIGNDQLVSIKVNANFRIKIYEDDNYQKLLGEFTEDVKDLGDKAKKTSSIVIERK